MSKTSTVTRFVTCGEIVEGERDEDIEDGIMLILKSALEYSMEHNSMARRRILCMGV